MKYEKPVVDIIKFENDVIFMAGSGNYSTAGEALNAMCSGFSGATNNFSCSDFGGYNASNPPSQKSKVTVGGGTYVFDYVGNHWKLEK